MYEYPSPRPVIVDVRVAAGLVDIVAEPRDTVSVEVSAYDEGEAAQRAAADTSVRLDGDRLRIEAPDPATGWIFWRGRRIHVEARVPVDSRLVLRTGSADLRCAGRYASATARTGSGDFAVQHITGDLNVTTGSGALLADRVDAQLIWKGGSGSAQIGEVAGNVAARSASGDLQVGRAGAAVRVHSASGQVRIDEASAGTVAITTASGAVRIGVRRGTLVWLDLTTGSGRVRTDLDLSGTAPAEHSRSRRTAAASTPDASPAGTVADLTVQVRTVSADIDVHRAAAPRAEPAPAAA